MPCSGEDAAYHEGVSGEDAAYHEGVLDDDHDDDDEEEEEEDEGDLAFRADNDP